MLNSRTTHVRTLNDASITTPQTAIRPIAERVFAAGLFLAIEAQKPLDRRVLNEVLWPETKQNLAAHRLRQTLLKLRRAGFPLETVNKGQLCVHAEEFVFDFENIDKFDHAELSEIRRILPGTVPDCSPMFAEWLDERRAVIAATLARQQLKEIDKCRKTGEWASAASLARSVLSYAPDNEEATLALAESMALQGNKTEALRLLDEYSIKVGGFQGEARLPATIMRRRISDKLPREIHDLRIETPFLGRGEHINRLTKLLEDARLGKPVAALVSGVAGIGKTRVVKEFLSFASLQGVAWHKVACRSTDSTRPLSLMLELFPFLRQMRGAIGSSPDTLDFLDALTRHRPDGSPPETRLHDFLPGAIDAALIDIVDAVTEESSLVIAIEDCHWIDTSSAEVLCRLAENLTTQRVLLLFTSRKGEREAIASLDKIVTLELNALSDDASSRILRSIVSSHDRQASDEYVDWCTGVAEGNPFFLHELANQWLETGEEHRSPPSLTSLLEQRIARLNDDALQVLQTCALLENHASLENLEEVLGYPPHQLLRSINELARAGMVLISNDHSHEERTCRLSSKHDLLSDTALALLPLPARAYLHRRAAKVLQRRIDERGEVSTLWACAKHWQLAGDVSQALRLAVSCANHLLDVGLPQDAAEVFGRASAFCVSDHERLSVLEAQTKAYYRSSNWVGVKSIGTEARALKQRLHPDATPHDELELMQLRADWLTLRWDEILSRSLQCLNAESATIEHRLDAAVMALMMLSFIDDGGEAEKVLVTIRNLRPNEPLLPAQLQAAMIYHTNWGSFSDAIAAAESLIALQRERADVAALFSSLTNAAVTFRAACKFDESRALLIEALQIADQHRLHSSRTRALPLLAHMALERGNYEEARRWLIELEKLDVDPNDSLTHVEVVTIRARLALVDRRIDEARVLVQSDLAQMRTDFNPHRRVYALALGVAVELASGRSPTAELISDLETAHLQSRANVFQGFAALTLYEGLVALGRRKNAQLRLAEYLNTFRREPCPPSKELFRFVGSLRTHAAV